MKEEKKGTITDLIYYNKENSYTIAEVENESEQFTVVGYLPGALKGRRFLFVGVWKEHPVYGSQFAFSEYREELPGTSEGIELFLASGALKGVGKKMAGVIVQAFGEETLRIIEEEPHRLTQIEGIGPKKAESIFQSFRAHREFAEITLHFQQFGISARAAMKLYREYGAGTVEAVQENPYRLVDDVFGFGFRSADRIAMKMGFERDSEYRIESGIRYMLWYYVNEGSTFAPKELLLEQTAQLLDITREEVEEVLIRMVFDGSAHLETLEERPVVFLESYFAAEQHVCRHLVRLEQAKPRPINSDVDSLTRVTEEETGIALSENQKYAVRESLLNGVVVITGGPGTGKTTIINTIINILRHSGLKTAIAAPTGRAAKRITETTGHEASTIHRLLEYYYSEGEDAMRFGKTEEDPLDCDAVIIDEASMIDIMLMRGLLSAIRSGTRLIIVGDADQLPSVGAGNVLRDMLESELISSVRLTEIFRQAQESLIVVNAHRINQGEYPDCNRRERDFFLLRRNGENAILQTIRELCARRLPEYYTGCDPVRDIQVLTPVRKGLLGCISLNRELQAALNPPRPEATEKAFGERLFREGDKVMQTRNNYQLSWRRQDDFSEGEGVFNGDVGYIHRIDTENGLMTVVYEDVRFVEYDFTQIEELDLAYAVTVHKSQGSEFPIVIMPMSWFPPMLSTRNLLYTAVTRGKKAVVLVGSEQQMQGMIDNNQVKERYSGLRYRLRRFLAPAGSEEASVFTIEDHFGSIFEGKEPTGMADESHEATD